VGLEALSSSLNWALAGLVSGALLGVTGAGGAIGAFPFFIYGLQMGVKEATTLSLYPVFLGALTNGWVQRKKSHLFVALFTALSSLVTSFAFVGIKERSSPEIVRWVFTVVCVYSVVSLWKNKKRAKKIARNISKNTSITIDEHFVPSFKPAKVFIEQVKTSTDPAKA
jgi:uncharacterized membrane protein YfcA